MVPDLELIERRWRISNARRAKIEWKITSFLVLFASMLAPLAIFLADKGFIKNLAFATVTLILLGLVIYAAAVQLAAMKYLDKEIEKLEKILWN